jgi:hypothetical protein
MSDKPEWKIREEAANLVNTSPAVDGKYKWKCDQCGAEWEEPAEWTDFVNINGKQMYRNDLPNWGVHCEECSKKFAEELKEKLK